MSKNLKNSLKIGIDLTFYNKKNIQRGVGRYTKNLVEALNKYTTDQVAVFTKNSNLKFDVIHYPFFEPFKITLPIIKKNPTVVTIHDVTPSVFPQKYPAGIKGSIMYFIQKKLLEKIDAVITDSNCSKNDIVKYLEIAPDKISTIYLAPLPIFRKVNNLSILSQVKEKYHLPKSFAIYVGDVNWNKNLLNLSSACEAAQIDLVLVGKSFEQRENLDHPELKSFNDFLKKYSLKKWVHILGHVNDEELVALYNLSSLTLLPSFYEGFGFPILESQACETPVVTSSVSSMPEIAGNGALFVEPESVNDIKKAIEKILSNDDLKKELITNGLKNTKRFSWQETALKTDEVYHKVVPYAT